MSNEPRGEESRYLAGSNPPSTSAERASEGARAGVEAATSTTMGDVLTKEPAKDDSANEELENGVCKSDYANTMRVCVAEEFKTPSLPTPVEEPVEQKLTPLDTSAKLESPLPLTFSQKKANLKECRLFEGIILNSENTVKTNKMNDQSYEANTTSTDNLCKCEECKWNTRDFSMEDLQEMMKLRRLGLDLRQYIRYTFNCYMETSGFSTNVSTSASSQQPQDLDSVEYFFELKWSAFLLCDRVPYHVFMWLVSQAQEFVISLKVQLLTLLYNRSIDNLAEVFLTKLLDGYDALLATAVHVDDLLEPLYKELFSKVNIDWGYINKCLYQNYVYNDPLIQNNLPPFIGQLRQYLPIKDSKYHYLAHRYFAFENTITKIGILFPEIERLIDKYNAEQVTCSVMKKVREDFKQFRARLKADLPITNIDLNNKVQFLKQVEDSNGYVQNEEILSKSSDLQLCSLPNAVEIQSMFNDWKKSPQQRVADLVEALTLSSALEEERKSKMFKKCYPSCVEKTINEDINKSVSCQKQTCKCHSNNPNIDSSLSLKQKISQNLQNHTINHCNMKSDNLKDPTEKEVKESTNCPALSRYILLKPSVENIKEPLKKIPKITSQTAQTQMKHSTTQTHNSIHNQGYVHRHHYQGRCSSHSHLHGSLSNAVIKSSGPHRIHVGHNNHSSAAVTCHKQQHIVEHIKRLSTSDLNSGENGDCSDSGSSHEDSCSTTNSPTPRDSNRHCDCCYCEVFGHGIPSVAPVSRNYNEMRERLRQLLSKKKAKVCIAACNPHSKNSVEVSSSSSSLSSSSSTSSTIMNVDSILPNATVRSNMPVSTNFNAISHTVTNTINSTNPAAPTTAVKSTEDPWNIEAIVEFIEGSQSGKKDKKKAEKKARQKQKKLEEKLRKKKEEEEQLKLIELQKKTPEVTITVVNPEKQISSQKTVPRHKLPEVSILPRVSTSSQFLVSKQTNAIKKKCLELTNVNIKNINKTHLTSSSLSTNVMMENIKKKTVVIEKINEVIGSKNAKSKISGKFNEIISKATISDNTDMSQLTKKERKKLRRELEKQKTLKTEIENKQNPITSENQSQIVTIKRIMESNNAEPTVTITLKGQTPAEDRVLFTLVNGQTKDSPEEKQSQSSSKKKKSKSNNTINQHSQLQTVNKSQSNNNNNNNNNNHINNSIIIGSNNNGNINTKSEQIQKYDLKNSKQQLLQINKDKHKTGKQQEELILRQQLNAINVDTKYTKSKKDKKKSNDNKENIMKSITTENLHKQENCITNKKSPKTIVTLTAFQKQQQNQQQFNSKSNKNQIQNQNQKKNNISNNSGKVGKSNSNHNAVMSKIDNQKIFKIAPNTSNKQKQNQEIVQNQKKEKETSTIVPSINIENLKLPPGITITKVDAPIKSLSLKSNSTLKPPNNSSKQTTIIAAPMSGVQSPNYGSSQGTGNVIVVDTGKLKQDLMPKNIDKDTLKDTNNPSPTSKKKKKKKNKNAVLVNFNEKINNGIQMAQANKQQQQQHLSDYMNVEPAKIVHNPSTNMVTIRNPAFGPPSPKLEPSTQQAAIIKVAENGMVTIRSPALQQAINAGLQPPPKPDFIVKGSTGMNESVKPSNNNFISGSELSSTLKGSNGLQLSTDLIELRRRLSQQSDHQFTTSTTLFNNGLSSIQISKVTNNQSPNIPENGINLKGTSVTLTKIRNVEPYQQHQQQQPFEEAKGNSFNGTTSTKSRKKKKRGNGVRQCGDDWNLVESVFTPKDIDLEDGEMDDAERELEAFKRFCFQSVPPPRKEKVNLNIKDIVLKKKSSSPTAVPTASATTPTPAVVAAT